MAQKKITDLQLRSNVSPDLNIPSDDGIQSYRVTATQIKNFVLPDNGLEYSKLADSIVEKLVPPGAVIAFAGPSSNVPEGFLPCNGAEVSRTTYENLYNAIGVAHGSGDGSTTFRLPDYRGMFLRGTAQGSSNDPDRNYRTAMNTGGNTGDAVGTVQGDATKKPNNNLTGSVSGSAASAGDHYHNTVADVQGPTAVTPWPGGTYLAQTGLSGDSSYRLVGTDYGPTVGRTSTQGSHSHTVSGSATINGGGDNETRPKNANVNYIIKY